MVLVGLLQIPIQVFMEEGNNAWDLFQSNLAGEGKGCTGQTRPVTSDTYCSWAIHTERE